MNLGFSTNTDFSDDIWRLISDEPYAFNARTGELYLPLGVVYCKPSKDGWIQDPDRPIGPSVPFMPKVPLVEIAQSRPRLRVVPTLGAGYLIVLDRADAETAEAFAPVEREGELPLLVRDRFTGCAGVLVFSAEVEVE